MRKSNIAPFTKKFVDTRLTETANYMLSSGHYSDFEEDFLTDHSSDSDDETHYDHPDEGGHSDNDGNESTPVTRDDNNEPTPVTSDDAHESTSVTSDDDNESTSVTSDESTPTTSDESTPVTSDDASDLYSHFDPCLCLFCPKTAKDCDANLTHMRVAHGFIIPERDHLELDEEILVQFLHRIISTDHECLLCGLTRKSRVAVQHHMVAKNHCRFELTDPNSEFHAFYNFPEPEPADYEAQPVVTGAEMWLGTGRTLQHRGLVNRGVCSPVLTVTGRNALPHQKAAEERARKKVHRKPTASSDDDNNNEDDNTGEEDAAKTGVRQLRDLEREFGKLRKGDQAFIMRLPPAERRSHFKRIRRDKKAQHGHCNMKRRRPVPIC